MKELLIIAVGSALVNNVVLSQFLGICPFLGVSKKIETAAGMGGATNCAVLGVSLNCVTKGYNILEGVVYGFSTAVGFTIAIVIMAGIREKIEYNDISESFQGTPIVLLTAALMSIAFFGFSGII